MFSAEAGKDWGRREGKRCLSDEMVSFCQEWNCLPKKSPHPLTRIWLEFHWPKQGHIHLPGCIGSGKVNIFKWALWHFLPKQSFSGKAGGRRGLMNSGSSDTLKNSNNPSILAGRKKNAVE